MDARFEDSSVRGRVRHRVAQPAPHVRVMCVSAWRRFGAKYDVTEDDVVSLMILFRTLAPFTALEGWRHPPPKSFSGWTAVEERPQTPGGQETAHVAVVHVDESGAMSGGELDVDGLLAGGQSGLVGVLGLALQCDGDDDDEACVPQQAYLRILTDL